MEAAVLRVAQLDSLDEEERALICLKLHDIGEDEVKRLVLDGIPNGVLGKMLRFKFLSGKVVPVRPEVAALVRSVPAIDVGEPTVASLSEYLLDFRCLNAIVPIARLPEVEDSLRVPFMVSNSELGELVTHAVYAKLSTATVQAGQVAFSFSMDRSEASASQSSSQTPRFGKRKRPHFLFKLHHLVMMFAEGRAEDTRFDTAVEEISRLPSFVYGEVRFMLAFVIAGHKFQFFLKRPSIEAPEAISRVYDLGQIDHRVELCFVFFKLYFVLLAMSKRMTIRNDAALQTASPCQFND